MGFIEELKRQKAQRDEEERLMLQAAERKAEIERENQKREILAQKEKTALREENLRKAEEQFEQTGIKRIVQELVGIKAAMGLGKEYKTHEDDSYRTRLNIRSYNEYVKIAVSPDGVVVFEGEEMKIEKKGFLGLKVVQSVIPLKVAISRYEWQGENGQELLEKALEKIYRNPHKDIPTSSSSSYQWGGETN